MNESDSPAVLELLADLERRCKAANVPVSKRAELLAGEAAEIAHRFAGGEAVAPALVLWATAVLEGER